MVGLDTMHMESLSGDHIEKMTEQQLAQVAPGISVFYRVTPRHKLCIVKVSSLLNFDSSN
jgi:magnesium-transporting ATPase (P-type)